VEPTLVKDIEQGKPCCIPPIFLDFLFKPIVTISLFLYSVYMSLFDTVVALCLPSRLSLITFGSCKPLANARHICKSLANTALNC
jgi:hypothetical protein